MERTFTTQKQSLDPELATFPTEQVCHSSLFRESWISALCLFGFVLCSRDQFQQSRQNRVLELDRDKWEDEGLKFLSLTHIHLLESTKNFQPPQNLHNQTALFVLLCTHHSITPLEDRASPLCGFIPFEYFWLALIDGRWLSLPSTERRVSHNDFTIREQRPCDFTESLTFH